MLIRLFKNTICNICLKSVSSTGNCPFFYHNGARWHRNSSLKKCLSIFISASFITFPSCMCHLTCGCPPLNERREGRGINGFCAFFFKRRNSFGAPPTSFGGFLFHARGGGGGEIWKKASPATMGRGMRRWSHSIQIKGGGKPGRHSPT